MAYGWRGEGLSSEGEPERMRFAGRADSTGRTHQADSERSPGRRANEAVRDGASTLRNWRLQSWTPSEHPRRATFYVAFGTFVGI